MTHPLLPVFERLSVLDRNDDSSPVYIGTGLCRIFKGFKDGLPLDQHYQNEIAMSEERQRLYDTIAKHFKEDNPHFYWLAWSILRGEQPGMSIGSLGKHADVVKDIK